jgi:hypothetical protein
MSTRPLAIIRLTFTLSVLTMVAISFGLVESNLDTSNTAVYGNRLKTLPCYFAMFGLAEVFELVMGLDALKLRNIIQLIGILIFHAMLIVSAGLQIHQTKTALVNPIGADGALVNPSNSCAGEGYKVSHECSIFDLANLSILDLLRSRGLICSGVKIPHCGACYSRR